MNLHHLAADRDDAPRTTTVHAPRFPQTLGDVVGALEARYGIGTPLVGRAGGGVACVRYDAEDGTVVVSTDGLIPVTLPDPDREWTSCEPDYDLRVDHERIASWQVAVYASADAADGGESPTFLVDAASLADAFLTLA